MTARPVVDAHGLAWVQRARFWWAAVGGEQHYHATFGNPLPGRWAVLHSDGRSPFREVTGPDAAVVVDGLKGWLVKTGGEVPV